MLSGEFPRDMPIRDYRYTATHGIQVSILAGAKFQSLHVLVRIPIAELRRSLRFSHNAAS